MGLSVVKQQQQEGGEVKEPKVKKEPKAAKKPAVKAEKSSEPNPAEITLTNGQVINLQLKKGSYLSELMRKISQKRDLLRKIDGWKAQQKKAKEVINEIDSDLEVLNEHFVTNEDKIK